MTPTTTTAHHKPKDELDRGHRHLSKCRSGPVTDVLSREQNPIAKEYISNLWIGAMLLPTAFVPSAAHAIAKTSSTSALPMAALTTGEAAARHVLPAVLAMAGGGGAVEGFLTSAGKLDMSRIRMRLEGLQAYGTISALLMNACLRLYSATPKKCKGKGHNMALDAFVVCVVIATLFGSYTTIVFSLLTLYCKRALGRGFDSAFLDFFSATDNLRRSAYRSFLFSLVSFEAAFLLSLCLTFEGPRRWRLLALAALISVLSLWRWSAIMALGKRILNIPLY